jgi:hypothetical protein
MHQAITPTIDAIITVTQKNDDNDLILDYGSDFCEGNTCLSLEEDVVADEMKNPTFMEEEDNYDDFLSRLNFNYKHLNDGLTLLSTCMSSPWSG